MGEEAAIREIPIADGGEGTVEAFVAAGATPHVARVHGPFGAAVDARYAIDGDSAIIEMASAAGYELLPPNERNARTASTYGVGELIAAALDRGARRIIVGMGGSATNDGGTGMLSALGARFLDAAGKPLEPGGAALAHLASIDLSELDSRLSTAEISGASDVENILCGPSGASAVFGPQKGASPEDVAELDAALAHFADVTARTLGVDKRTEASTGAAGGLGFGLATFLGARLRSGIDVVIEVAGLDRAIAAADLCITGEGRIDSQTVGGKAIVGIARIAQPAGVPVVALCGSLGDGAEEPLARAGVACFPIAERPITEEEAMRDAAHFVERAAARLARLLRFRFARPALPAGPAA